MKSAQSRYHGHRYPPEIISHAVWLYYRFDISFRAVEDLLMNIVLDWFEELKERVPVP